MVHNKYTINTNLENTLINSIKDQFEHICWINVQWTVGGSPLFDNLRGSNYSKTADRTAGVCKSTLWKVLHSGLGFDLVPISKSLTINTFWSHHDWVKVSALLDYSTG